MNLLKGPMAIITTYGVGVNAGAAYMFYYDKQQAIQHKWRVRESTLQLTALAGGWIGGMWAMEQFKHKRAKQSFKNVYFSAVAGNIAILSGLVYALKKRPQLIPDQLRKLLLPAEQHQHQHHSHQQTYTTNKHHNNQNNYNNNNNNYNNNNNNNRSIKFNRNNNNQNNNNRFTEETNSIEQESMGDNQNDNNNNNNIHNNNKRNNNSNNNNYQGGGKKNRYNHKKNKQDHY
ncbi:hypothetical protein DFA_07467 [Cavenderia fasciculata]|uniref:Transmembrane protein n=1 Tax=Cavenderia fasciculata TaxID=261658 RepID=F4PWH9_CACFS|nr:uncharacterized protein DFA_07467 [Cavenderia fasciculata]EGG20343.1 hypothetical protein DFA_07467 [Cavenderia fasciculata]|eukprot:XP_004367326.1 hypothetical protein DFA_07467 [Cavenderia fasciculata]